MDTAAITEIKDARSHLKAALSQAIPTDDQIIVGHMRDALAQIEAVIRECAGKVLMARNTQSRPGCSQVSAVATALGGRAWEADKAHRPLMLNEAEETAAQAGE